MSKTYPDLPDDASQQEIFDAVWHRMNEQGKPAMDEGSCSYLTPDGRRCAIGIILPKDTPNTILGLTGGVDALINEAIRLAEDGTWEPPIWLMRSRRATSEQQEFLIELQNCHDNAQMQEASRGNAFLPDFQQRMRELAINFELEAPADA